MSEKVELDSGKYTVVLQDDGRFECLRYGQPWRDLAGDNMVYYLFARIRDLEGSIEDLKEGRYDSHS